MFLTSTLHFTRVFDMNSSNSTCFTKEKPKRTPKGARGTFKNTCETRISAICTCFYVFLAIWPARGPARKGGRGVGGIERTLSSERV